MAIAFNKAGPGSKMQDGGRGTSLESGIQKHPVSKPGWADPAFCVPSQSAHGARRAEVMTALPELLPEGAGSHLSGHRVEAAVHSQSSREALNWNQRYSGILRDRHRW